MVNFVSIFCLELQKPLKPIYDLTRKGRQFIWGEEQQKAFDKINIDCKDLQVYTYLTDMDDFNYTLTPVSLLLVVHYTRFRMDSQCLLPMQVTECQRQLRTILFQSKEMCGLAMNIATFLHLLKKVDFDVVVDHLAITHIMRSKAEPAMTRIKRLIELLSPFSNLYLSDFLSRQKMDDSNPHKIIPVSFTLKSLTSNHSINLTT